MSNVFDEMISAQKHGEAKGIPSICSAHPRVIRQTLKVSETFRVSPLIEATCNQVNQFGGYTGMTPKDFVAYVRSIAEANHFPFENVILGGLWGRPVSTRNRSLNGRSIGCWQIIWQRVGLTQPPGGDIDVRGRVDGYSIALKLTTETRRH
jgi:hypothetical protein